MDEDTKQWEGIYAEWCGGRYAAQWDMPRHPPVRWILEQESTKPIQFRTPSSHHCPWPAAN